MADKRAQIQFFDTMNVNKRAEKAAYLRYNCYPSRDGGLYPSADFITYADIELAITNSGSGAKVVKRFTNVLFIQSNAGLYVYKMFNGVPSQTNFLSNAFYADSATGNDGIHLITGQGSSYTIWKVSEVGGLSSITSIALDGGGVAAPAGAKIVIDDTFYYYIVNTKIYRALGSAVPTEVFSGLQSTPKFVQHFNSYLVLFYQIESDIMVLFWDKTDPTLFARKVYDRNAIILAGGSIAGKLYLVKSIGNISNTHERWGEIVAAQYNGEYFQKVNSIKSGYQSLSYRGHTVGNEVMYFVAYHDNPTRYYGNGYLYRNMIYKLRDDGSIEVAVGYSGITNVTALDIQYDYLSVGYFDTSGHYADNKLGSITQTTSYITNFMNNAGNRHKLDGIGIVFEKLLNTGSSEEELKISYRLSERDTFTTLKSIKASDVRDDVDNRMSDSDKTVEYDDYYTAMTHQIYDITRMPDGSSLPEFNEIQFMFELKNGFSIIDAWYDYSYIKRNTRS